ncbi:synaptotagmin-3 isoform X1 [Tripterygium wilfordii]|uniref:Synaptotagmin-3 isoform X1 n=1 Tax=Tripterygium wilfordii TaxID=458696 RepID=A0A7J7CI76_TRIWF|nr:synaptotagmin-3-like isoform X1 [Tripterygium wilfordii]XP_038679654.1 synaptotagmin-3-like isoform X1 [Tripterygium wilfordii]KAF5733739.1 synaptotagmin-3 isoform X1 [Tripterygium wilfordii]
MGFLSTFVGVVGFGIGVPLGLLVGFFLFVDSQPKDIEDPVCTPLTEMDATALLDVLPEVPLWVKSPDYDRMDWLNKFVSDMWPFLDKAICATIRNTAEPIFKDYTGKYLVEAIEFQKLSLGTLPPTFQGIKVFETNEKELVMEPAIRWAGNPNITLVIKLKSFRITVQLVDLQIFVAPRITLKPLVSTFPCFAKIVVSLMEKPHVDFGLKILGGDVMSIPGLYHIVQETIKKQVASLYLWPQTLEIPILDASTGAIKKPVGILHVKVVRAMKLLKMDFLGTSDPYVKLSLTGERLPARKTTIKKKNLNPEWNEKFKLIVKEPQSQVLRLQVYDWDKVGKHDKLGMQLVPLKLLTPHETKELTLDLLKSTDVSDPKDQKKRGQIVVELTFVPFKADHGSFDEVLERYERKQSGIDSSSDDETLSGAGLLSVTLQGAEDVEGERHNNPHALVLFRGETKKTKMIRKTRDPRWNEEFQFMLEDPPLHEKIRIEVVSKRSGFSFRSKESLGYVEIDLTDIVRNGRINQKYHLIDSRNGLVHVEIRWTTVEDRADGTA